MSGLSSLVKDTTLYQLISISCNWQNRIHNALETGVGPYKNFTCVEIHQLLWFAEMFDDCLDKNDYSLKTLANTYLKLSNKLKKMVPKSIVAQMVKLK